MDFVIKSPLEARQILRNGKLRGRPTSGFCQGFKQANLAVVHGDLADAFEEFCRANSGPLPLLYRSQLGQFSAPPLATDSDIRTDLSQYKVIESGEVTQSPGDLLEYNDELERMVFFYLGCSFSFEEALITAGIPVRNIEQNKNSTMFKTSVRCQPVAPFDCYQVVSMRPVPCQLVETAFRVTHAMGDVHGAPIHIGNPAAIGIRDLSAPDFGDVVEFREGDVPVFWSCGVTGIMAVCSPKSALAFTHSPGCMYLSDVPCPEYTMPSHPDDLPCVLTLSRQPYSASATSQGVVERIRSLEKCIQEDPGKRGIAGIVTEGDLLLAALSLSHSTSVGITTGFPCMPTCSPPEETDGPPGAFAIAAILQTLGKKVALIVDIQAQPLMQTIMRELVQLGILGEEIEVECFPPSGLSANQSVAHAFMLGEGGEGGAGSLRYDHLVAIERPGMARDGRYYSMRAHDISAHVAQIDFLFMAAKELGVATTGIGDGGNELGMGKVLDRVAQSIPNGGVIACQMAADYLIVAGVSNWAGYALALALHLLRRCPIHRRYLRRAVGHPGDCDPTSQALPTPQREEEVLRIMVNHRIHDGVLKELAMSVDGLPFNPIHSNKIKQLSQFTSKPLEN